MDTGVLTLAEEPLWTTLWLRLPSAQRQPWLTPQWYALFESYGYGQACCFVYRDQLGTAIYPFLLNPIPEYLKGDNEDCFDIQGAPGYNGIGAVYEHPAFLQYFHLEFAEWCQQKRVVAEFSRCDPVSQNHKFFPAEAVFEVNRNVVVDLHQPKKIRSGYHRSTRKNIRKAQKEGLRVEMVPGGKATAEEIEIFTRIYLDTMERHQADQSWRFTREFFADAAQLLGDALLFYFTFDYATPVAAEMVVAGEEAAYSWLGGTLPSAFPKRPNDLLKDEIIHNLAASDMKWYCLGGGMTPGDGIHRYKKTFALHGEMPFFIAKRIHMPLVYYELVENWKSRYQALVAKYSHRLLAYRETV